LRNDAFAILRAVTRRRLLVGGGLVAIALAVAIGLYVKSQNEPLKKRGSATEEFVTTEEPDPKPPPEKENPRPWPTYGYDDARQHISPYDHRPPYKRLWTIDAHDTLEFPPALGYGRMYLAQQKGLFFALDAETGKVDWRKSLGRCAASSPTVGKGVVYQAYMHRVVCAQDQPGADGFVVAWDAQTGRERWRYKTAPIESSPLLHGKRLFFGAWDHGVHAINANNGRRIWRFPADNQVNTSAAYWRGRIFIGDDSGTLYALSAKTGRELWRQHSKSRFGAREFWYATPTVAYGRVYIGNTDGTMYVYGAKTGNLLWARPLGTYIYGAAAIYRRKVFVGTYDGKFYALDAATGDVRWQIDAGGAVHSAPTVMDGLVYYAVCSSCGEAASRFVARGPDATNAVRVRDGKRVWHFEAGKYANPVIADQERIYVTGRAHQFALARKGSKVVKDYLKRARAAKRHKERRAARATRAEREKRQRARSRRAERREKRADRR
jgi:outer membrane protein assembly factor BamB